MVEYAVLLSLIALALVGPVFGLGQQVGNRFQSITNELSNGGSSGTPDPGTPTPPTTSPTTTPGPDTGEKPDPDPETGGTVDPSKTPLKDVTWEELDKLSPDAAKDPDKYKPWLGQSIHVKVDNKTYDMQLVGLAHDSLASGTGKAGFTFLSKQILEEKYSRNFGTLPTSEQTSKDGYTDYGWKNSSIRSWLNGTFYNDLLSIQGSDGAELKSVIKEVKKSYNYYVMKNEGGNSIGISTKGSSSDRIWVPSLNEVYSDKSFKNMDDATQFEYYANNSVTSLNYGLLNKRTWGNDPSGYDGQRYYWTRNATDIESCYIIFSLGNPFPGNYNKFGWLDFPNTMVFGFSI